MENVAHHIYRLLSVTKSRENTTRNIILFFAGIIVMVAGYLQLPGILGSVGPGAEMAMIMPGIIGYKNKKVY